MSDFAADAMRLQELLGGKTVEVEPVPQSQPKLASFLGGNEQDIIASISELPLNIIDKMMKCCQQARDKAKNKVLTDHLALLASEGLTLDDLNEFVGQKQAQHVRQVQSSEFVFEGDAQKVEPAAALRSPAKRRRNGTARKVPTDQGRMPKHMSKEIMRMVRQGKPNWMIEDFIYDKYKFVIPTSSMCNLRKRAKTDK